MSDEIRYTDAFEELRLIVKEMESGDIEIDELSEKVKRAAVLIRICRDKLMATELDVKQILSDLEASED